MYGDTMRGMCGCPRCLDDILEEVSGKLAAAKLTGDAHMVRAFEWALHHYTELRWSLEPLDVPRR